MFRPWIAWWMHIMLFLQSQNCDAWSNNMYVSYLNVMLHMIHVYWICFQMIYFISGSWSAILCDIRFIWPYLHYLMESFFILPKFWSFICCVYWFINAICCHYHQSNNFFKIFTFDLNRCIFKKLSDILGH